MRRLAMISAMFTVLILGTAAAPTDPDRHVILIQPGDVELHAEVDSTLGSYYTISYSLPEGISGEELDRALLEVYVDVSAKLRGEGYTNEAPVLEVYALTQPFAGSLNLEILDRSSRVVRPVGADAERRVVVDVTSIIRSHLSGAIQNNGLIIGSVTGMREGEFILSSGKLPQGAVGKIVIYRRHEFVPSDVPSESGQ